MIERWYKCIINTQKAAGCLLLAYVPLYDRSHTVARDNSRLQKLAYR